MGSKLAPDVPAEAPSMAEAPEVPEAPPEVPGEVPSAQEAEVTEELGGLDLTRVVEIDDSKVKTDDLRT